MRQFIALVGIAFAGANLLVAYTFLMSGFTEKVATKGITQQLLLWSGGALIGLFALLLVVQCVSLAISRQRSA